MKKLIRLIVNGDPHELYIDTRRTLLDVLRNEIGLLGAHRGCDEGECGACTVHIDGLPMNSCLRLAVDLDGAEILTVEGGAQMGLGYALTEELIVSDGRVLNPDFRLYRLFTAADMPQIESYIIETDDPAGPFGAKGVGEMGGTPTAAAVANAIYDAVGVRLTELPMTPERVLTALDKKYGRRRK